MSSSEKPLSGFNLTNPIKIIVHGFQNGPKMTPVVEIGEAYFSSKRPVNVFYVNYQQLSYRNYIMLRQEVPNIAAEVAHILKKHIFHTHGLPFLGLFPSLNSVHIIGHSLGAHISGQIGKLFDGQIGRITGLDPALPLFTPISPDRLQRNDAKFVDVIHSSYLGDMRVTGHADFYPNGGRNQPKCMILDGIFSCKYFLKIVQRLTEYLLG